MLLLVFYLTKTLRICTSSNGAQRNISLKVSWSPNHREPTPEANSFSFERLYNPLQCSQPAGKEAGQWFKAAVYSGMGTQWEAHREGTIINPFPCSTCLKPFNGSCTETPPRPGTPSDMVLPGLGAWRQWPASSAPPQRLAHPACGPGAWGRALLGHWALALVASRCTNSQRNMNG